MTNCRAFLTSRNIRWSDQSNANDSFVVTPLTRTYKKRLLPKMIDASVLAATLMSETRDLSFHVEPHAAGTQRFCMKIMVTFRPSVGQAEPPSHRCQARSRRLFYCCHSRSPSGSLSLSCSMCTRDVYFETCACGKYFVHAFALQSVDRVGDR